MKNRWRFVALVALVSGAPTWEHGPIAVAIVGALAGVAAMLGWDHVERCRRAVDPEDFDVALSRAARAGAERGIAGAAPAARATDPPVSSPGTGRGSSLTGAGALRGTGPVFGYIPPSARARAGTYTD